MLIYLFSFYLFLLMSNDIRDFSLSNYIGGHAWFSVYVYNSTFLARKANTRHLRQQAFTEDLTGMTKEGVTA